MRVHLRTSWASSRLESSMIFVMRTVGKSSLLLPARRSMLDMPFFLVPTTGEPGAAAGGKAPGSASAPEARAAAAASRSCRSAMSAVASRSSSS